MSSDAVISGDGRYVFFASDAGNLVAPERSRGREPDVFRRDLQAGTTELVSVTLRDGFGGGVPTGVSTDGRYVVFTSIGAGLVEGDTNGVNDVFVRDMTTSTTTRVSVTSTGDQTDYPSLNGAISADGRAVAFESSGRLVKADLDAGTRDIYVRDLDKETTTLVSATRSGRQSHGRWPAISGNGRFVTFTSGSARLVRADTNDKDDIFLRDLVKGATARVSVSRTEEQARGAAQKSRLTRGGNLVFFESAAPNLVRGDRNDHVDVFVRNRAAGTTSLISVNSREQQAGATSALWDVTSDGRFVLFGSDPNFLHGTSFEGLYLRDRSAGKTYFLGPEGGFGPATISDDGHRSAFETWNPNLVENDDNEYLDVFLYRW